jgi:hypothetical protein
MNHCTIDLLFVWFGLVCFANQNKNCQLSYSWFKTSQTGGQRYSDTYPFSIPCLQVSLSLSLNPQYLFYAILICLNNLISCWQRKIYCNLIDKKEAAMAIIICQKRSTFKGSFTCAIKCIYALRFRSFYTCYCVQFS